MGCYVCNQEEEIEDLKKLITDLRKYVQGSLPTHLARGGEADRQRLLQKIERVLTRPYGADD